VRYRVVPDAGYDVLNESDVSSKSKDYLFEEIKERLSKGSASFKLLAQIAEAGDPTNDATKHWPEDRKQIELGTIKIDTYEEDNESKKEQQRIIFDPVPRIDGVEASDDPIIEMRAALYLISGKERRAAAPSA
jgi:catalase